MTSRMDESGAAPNSPKWVSGIPCAEDCPTCRDKAKLDESDRTIHALLSSGELIVRFDKAGKWYRESDGRRVQISIAEAVNLATLPGSVAYLRRPGGGAFDARVRRQS